MLYDIIYGMKANEVVGQVTAALTVLVFIIVNSNINAIPEINNSNFLLVFICITLTF